MSEITATEAARRLNVTDKTLRAWIKQGKLQARHITSTRLAIKEEDLEALAQEISEHVTAGGYLEVNALIERVNALEARIADLEGVNSEQAARFTELERRLTALEAAPNRHKQAALFDLPATQKSARPAPAIDLPDGAILASEFAESHGVNRRTFFDHMTVGIGRDYKEKASHHAIENPARPRETIRYLMPDEQEAALDYWQRHGVAFH